MKLLVLGFLFASSVAWASPTGVVTIADPSSYRQVLAVSDVHGMAANLGKLLAGAGVVDGSGNWSAGNTLLVIVGDSIDKGPDSLSVLDTWLKLGPQAAAAGGRILPLLGNHEAEFLSDPGDDKKAKALLAELKQKKLPLADLTDADHYAHARFLRDLPLAARVGQWLFCHAGLFPGLSWQAFADKAQTLLTSGSYGDDFFIGDSSILEAKDWWSDDSTRQDLESRLSAEGLYGVVFGHQPSALGVKGNLATTDGGRLIKIDNGMAPESGAHPGHILQFAHPIEMNSPAPATVYSIGEDGTPTAIEEVSKEALKKAPKGVDPE